MAGQQSMHIACSAHSVAAEHMDGLIKVILHLVLLWEWCGRRGQVRDLGHLTLPRPMWPGSKHVPAWEIMLHLTPGKLTTRFVSVNRAPVLLKVLLVTRDLMVLLWGSVSKSREKWAQQSHPQGCLPYPRNGDPCACPHAPHVFPCTSTHDPRALL